MNDEQKQKPWAVITGASGGIGYELAAKCAEDGYNLVLVSRNQEKLDDVAGKLGAVHKVLTRVIALDLSDAAAADRVNAETDDIQVEVLINNAGFGDHSIFAASDISTQLSMIDLNVRTLVHLTKLFVPRMLRHRKGYVLNVASTASFMPGPYMATYFASKAFVRVFSESVAVELEGSGVSVTTLCPGPTETGFGSRAHMNMSLFHKTAMRASDVATIGYDALKKRKTVVVAGWLNKIQVMLAHTLPSSVVRKIMAKMLRE